MVSSVSALIVSYQRYEIYELVGKFHVLFANSEGVLPTSVLLLRAYIWSLSAFLRAMKTSLTPLSDRLYQCRQWKPGCGTTKCKLCNLWLY